MSASGSGISDALFHITEEETEERDQKPTQDHTIKSW